MIETMQRCLCQTDKIAFRLIVSVDNVQGLTRHMIRRRCRVMERVGDEEEKGTKVEVVLSSSSKPKLWAGIIVVVIVVVVIVASRFKARRRSSSVEVRVGGLGALGRTTCDRGKDASMTRLNDKAK